MPVMSGRPAIQRLQNHEGTRFRQQPLHDVQKGSYSPEMIEEDKMSPEYRGKTEREDRTWPLLEPRLVPNAQGWGCPWCPQAALLLAAVVGQALGWEALVDTMGNLHPLGSGQPSQHPGRCF